MAGGAVIGALRVVLGADSAALDKGLKEASGKLAAFGKTVASAGAVAGAALAAAAVGIGVAMKNAVNEADKLNKASQSIGIPVEELSKLKYAAELSDVAFESLSTAVGRFSRNMAEAAKDGTGEAALAFKAIGVAVQNTDGTLRNSSAVIQDVATKFQGYKDGAEKTALAIQLFGRAGADLIPLLNAGGAGLREMGIEAEKLGLVIDTKTAKAAEGFNDNLTRLGKVWDGIITQVLAKMAPAFENISQVLVNAAKNSGIVTTAATALTTALRGLVSAGVIVGAVFQTIGHLLGSVGAAIFQVAKGDFAAALESLKGSAASVQETWRGTAEAVKMIWDDAATSASTSAQTLGQQISAPIVQSSATVKKAAGEAEQALRRIYAEGRRTFEETRTPAEMFGVTIGKLNAQYQAGAISAETYGRAVRRAQDEMIAANPIAQGLGSALESAFNRAIEGGAKFQDIAKGLLQDLARLASSMLFKSLMGSGGPLGALFGGVGAPLNLMGFASGGSFTVGGSGGIDSQLAAFRVTPGEQVTVTKPGQGGQGGDTFVYSPTIDARGADAAAVARLAAVIAEDKKNFARNVVTTVQSARINNPNFLRS